MPVFRPHSVTLAVAIRMALFAMLLGGVIFALVYALVADLSRNAVQQTIDTDIEGLADQLNTHGEAILIARIRDRTTLQPLGREQSYYLLLDPAGRTLVGNLGGLADQKALSTIDPATSEAGELRITGEDYPVAVRATLLTGGLQLYDGLSMRRSGAMLARLRLVFGGALLLLTLGTFATGLAASWKLRARLGDLSTKFGALTGLPGAPAQHQQGDEIDGLRSSLDDVARRISALLTAQRDVADNIAHETRTPLIVVEARLADILEHSRDPVVLEYAEQARQETRSLVRLLDALLDIASVEAQRGVTDGLEEISLSKICRSLGDLYCSSILEAGMTLSSNIAPDVTMKGDAMQISRLVVNLLDNAIKYGAGGQEIRLTVAAGPTLVVEDDGDGIAPEDRERIFVRYARGRAVHAHGHGLGLPLVRAIATRHGLSVRVEARDAKAARKGTRFIVEPTHTSSRES